MSGMGGMGGGGMGGGGMVAGSVIGGGGFGIAIVDPWVQAALFFS